MTTQEVELKLALAPEWAERIGQDDLLGPPDKEDWQVSTYFDTPEQVLRKANCSLRIRQVGNRRTQTAKANNADSYGLFSRHEWEQEVDGDFPVLDADVPLAALLGERAGTLMPQFEVQVMRHKWDMSEGDSRIEVVLDRGKVSAGDAHLPICELEMELDGGKPKALFALARRLHADVPMRIGVATKSEQGFRLQAGLKSYYKSEPVRLTPGMTAMQAFEAIAFNCIRQYRLNEDVLLAGDGAEAVHQARVGLRRLRSALKLFKPMLKGKKRDVFMAELGWLAGLLGQVRDLDVIMALTSDTALQAQLKHHRQAAYADLLLALHTHRCRALFLDLSEWLVAGGWRQRKAGAKLRAMSARAFAGSALDKWMGRVLVDDQRIDQLDDAARHAVRKSAKVLRYGVEFFALLFDEKGERKPRIRFLSYLEDVQDHLGELNDMAARQEMLVQWGLDTSMPGQDVGADEARRQALLRRSTDSAQLLRNADPYWR